MTAKHHFPKQQQSPSPHPAAGHTSTPELQTCCVFSRPPLSRTLASSDTAHHLPHRTQAAGGCPAGREGSSHLQSFLFPAAGTRTPRALPLPLRGSAERSQACSSSLPPLLFAKAAITEIKLAASEIYPQLASSLALQGVTKTTILRTCKVFCDVSLIFLLPLAISIYKNNDET